MKKLLIAAALAASATPALAQVGISVNIGEPGFYGQINLGGAPPPQVIYSQPVLIDRDRGGGEPLYLRVPPGHEKHWDRHCGQYNACGRPVYFVRDDWYSNVYAPQYRREHGRDHDDRDRHDEGRGRGDDDRDHGHGDDDHGHRGHD